MKKLNSYIDHTILKPDATTLQVEKICQEAKKYKFASVCVNPYFVPLCHEKLKKTNVKVCSVIGFPLGANSTETKVFETQNAIAKGAEEIDMVINIGSLKSKDYKTVEADIKAVVDLCHIFNVITKVILETCLLTDAEIRKACLIAKKCKADFVKTSTGFSSGGATVKAVSLMRKTVGSKMGVKAAGGIRTKKDALAMIKAGATRIGASAGVKIVSEKE